MASFESVAQGKIDGPDFDLLERPTGTKIGIYCLQNNVSSHAKYRIKLAFEELSTHLLRPVLGHVPVVIAVEHSEKEDSTAVTASYGGESFDPAQSEDDFSYDLLRNMVRSLSYRYDPEAEQANTVRVLV